MNGRWRDRQNDVVMSNGRDQDGRRWHGKTAVNGQRRNGDEQWFEETQQSKRCMDKKQTIKKRRAGVPWLLKMMATVMASALR